MKRLFFFIGILLISFVVTPSGHALAVSGADWQAGRIIDDGVFTDTGSMSANDVQTFLNQKVGTTQANGTPGVCDTNGLKTSELGGGTRAQYGAAHSNPTPFTCLKDYYEVPKVDPAPGVPANNYGGQPIPAGAQSAAQIIWNAAQRYGINPRVLLVTIQKESAGPLVTDDWPFLSQYTYAMGAHCPDTAPCDSNYAGFSMQINESARLFRYYLTNMTQPWWSYKKPGINSILYNPNAACGSSNVNVTTSATAALYTYTPYQPNQAALNDLYGPGDHVPGGASCSSFGNRNFWRTFNDWFGTTNGQPFYAQYVSESPYQIIDSGSDVSIYFKFKNTGTAFWKDDKSTFNGYPPVHIATSGPLNRGSQFAANNWLSGSRPTGVISKVYESDGMTLAQDQQTVLPGQIGMFSFTLYANPNIPGGIYREYFQPIAEGAPNGRWYMGNWVYIDVGVNKPNFKAAYDSQSAYPTISKGGSSDAFVQFKNTGTSIWFDDVSVMPGKRPIHLATTWPINHTSLFGSTWPSPSRAGVTFTKVFENDGTTLATNQHAVQPGQIARFDFKLSVLPNQASGTYREYFQPVVEGAPYPIWDTGSFAWLTVVVP